MSEAARRPGRALQATLLRVLALALLAPAGWALWQASRSAVADAAATPAVRLLRKLQMGQEARTPATLAEVHQGLARALAATPEDATLHMRLGDLHAVSAAAAAASAPAAEGQARAQQAYQLAAASFEAAAQLRPQDPVARVRVADMQFALQQPLLGWQHWRQARSLGPYEGGVLALALDHALADWPHAPADVQAWISARFEAGSPAERSSINAQAKEFGLELKVQ
jgi:hypothetical protein